MSATQQCKTVNTVTCTPGIVTRPSAWAMDTTLVDRLNLTVDCTCWCARPAPSVNLPRVQGSMRKLAYAQQPQVSSHISPLKACPADQYPAVHAEHDVCRRIARILTGPSVEVHSQKCLLVTAADSASAIAPPQQSMPFHAAHFTFMLWCKHVYSVVGFGSSHQQTLAPACSWHHSRAVEVCPRSFPQSQPVLPTTCFFAQLQRAVAKACVSKQSFAQPLASARCYLGCSSSSARTVARCQARD